MSAETSEFILMRFDATMQSFGGVLVDQNGPTMPCPGRSMLTGLIANAFGWLRMQFDDHQALQERIRFGVRVDRAGTLVTDYQTVDLGQPYMREGMWTTRGEKIVRTGQNSERTHIRLRDYFADAVFTVALALDQPDEEPTLENIEQSLIYPARPLYLGRKPCVPSDRIFLRKTQAASMREALVAAPRPCRGWCDERALNRVHQAQLFLQDTDPTYKAGTRLWSFFERDWANRMAAGQYLMREETIVIQPEGAAS